MGIATPTRDHIPRVGVVRLRSARQTTSSFVCAASHDRDGVVSQRLPKRLPLVPRRTHPDVALRSAVKIDCIAFGWKGLDRRVRCGRHESVDAVRSRALASPSCPGRRADRAPRPIRKATRRETAPAQEAPGPVVAGRAGAARHSFKTRQPAGRSRVGSLICATYRKPRGNDVAVGYRVSNAAKAPTRPINMMPEAITTTRSIDHGCPRPPIRSRCQERLSSRNV
jgi:hypothetical protein